MTQPQHDIQIVIFDLGRVLIRICDHWHEACNIAGVTPTDALGDKAIAAAILDLGNEFESGRLTPDDYFALAASHAGMSPDDVSGVVSAWLKGPFEGGEALIDELLAADITTACLSNTNHVHWQLMHEHPKQKLPLTKLHHRFASHIIGCMKPEAGIYQHVEDTTGLPPEAIVFFDDNAANIAAARGRGWRAHQIDTSADPITQMRNKLTQLGVL